jgi:hypothetical protein
VTESKITIRRKIHFDRVGRAKVAFRPSTDIAPAAAHRVPRVARLMALAIYFDELIAEGQLTGFAELARLGHVTRARVTQIMNLLYLAPDIQQAILFLPGVDRGPDPITERDLRPIAAELHWQRQRALWSRLRRRVFAD